MVIEQGSRPYLYVDVWGPPGWDPATTVGEVALTSNGEAPDWLPATWDEKRLRVLVGTVGVGGGAAEFAAGEYQLKVRLTCGPEQVVWTPGHVRVEA